MMTAEELMLAVYMLRLGVEQTGCEKDAEIEKVRKKTVEAVEKQVPQSPVYYRVHSVENPVPQCPECNAKLQISQSYCSSCGQKIDITEY